MNASLQSRYFSTLFNRLESHSLRWLVLNYYSNWIFYHSFSAEIGLFSFLEYGLYATSIPIIIMATPKRKKSICAWLIVSQVHRSNDQLILSSKMDLVNYLLQTASQYFHKARVCPNKRLQ